MTDSAGLDAAVEAAIAAASVQVGDRIWPTGAKLTATDVNAAIRERLEIGVRAAAPHIRRAVLEEAAAEIEAANCYGESGVVAWLRDRAGEGGTR